MRHNKIGVVIIGRNEGQRLISCLESVLSQRVPVVYVDSESSDDSVLEARKRNVHTIELDSSIPLSAARARNEGFFELIKQNSDIEFVHFIDGDCELHSQWLSSVRNAFEQYETAQVIFGRLREKNRSQSVFMTLCDIDWYKPPGLVTSCGGIATYRRSIFEQLNGFNSELVSGEEPEFCSRITATGGTVRCIDSEMGTHDAAMTKFSQWWTRTTKVGFGYRSGSDWGGWKKQYRSTLIWGFILPTAILTVSVIFSAKLLWLFLIYPLQILKIFLSKNDIGTQSKVDRFWYAFFCVLGKFAEVQGLAKHFLNEKFANHRENKLIEYKANSSDDESRIQKKKAIKQAWKEDKARYPKRPWLKEISIVAVGWYRFGQHVDNMPSGIRKKIAEKCYWIIFHFIEILTGVSLPKSIEIGGGLRIYHFGNIFIHKNAKIGKNCTLRQGVTIGNRHNDEKAPVIHDNVELGAYAQILGDITLGANAKVGAMTVVLKDVPANKTICGQAGSIVN